MKSYQREDTSGGGLVLSALGEEQQTLAGLAGPGGERVRDGGLLSLEVLGEGLDLNGLVVEVEVALDEAEAPINTVSFPDVPAGRR